MKKSFKLLSLLVTVGMLSACTIEVRPLPSEGGSTQESVQSEESQGGHSEATSETESHGGQSQESTESHESQGGSSQGGSTESTNESTGSQGGSQGGGESQTTTETTSQGGNESQGGQTSESQGGTSESTAPVKTPHHITASYDNDNGPVFVGETLNDKLSVNPELLSVELYYSDNSHVSILESDDLSYTYQGADVDGDTVFDTVKVYEITAHYAPASLSSELTASFTVNVQKRAVTGVTISAAGDKLNLETEESIELSVVIEPSNATVKDVEWTYDHDIFSMVGNTLTASAITSGSGSIVYATVDGRKSNELEFQVTAKHKAVTSIELNKTALELKHHETFDLSVTSYLPTDASNTTWVFTSSDPTHVTVNASTGHVEAVGYTDQSVTISVKNELNEGLAECLVEVQKLDITSVAIARQDDAVLANNYEIGDEDVQLKAVVTPSTATDAGGTVDWDSSNELVATVNNGLLHIVGPGSASIKATVGGKESPAFDITVSYKAVTEISSIATELTLDVSDDVEDLRTKTTLGLAVLPQGANPNMTFTIKEGDTFVSLSESTVTPLKEGTAVITATSVGKKSDDSYATLDITIHVTNLYGTETDPLSVVELNTIAEGLNLASGAASEHIYYAEVVVSEVTAKNTTNNYIDFKAAIDSTHDFVFYHLNGSATLSINDVELGSTVLVRGPIKNHNGTTLEMVSYKDSNNNYVQGVLNIDNETITGLSVPLAAKDMVVGNDYQIIPVKLPASSSVQPTFESDSAHATVDATGTVHAVSAGSANITVTCGDLHETVAITVTKLPELVSINFTETELELKQNETHQMVLEFTTDDSSPASDAQQEVTYSIKEGSASDFITVSATGLVTALPQETNPAGKTATVVATSDIDLTIKAECVVSVTNQRIVAQSLDATFNATTELSDQEVASSYASGNMTIEFSVGTGSSSPKYYDNGTALRMYQNNTITVSRTAGTISKITFGFAPNNDTPSNAITPSVGTFTTNTWTGSANSVVFSFAGARRIQTIRVEGSESIETIQYTFDLTQTLSHATSSNVLLDSINRGDDVDITFTAESGYSLVPTDVVVLRDNVETADGVTVTQQSENVVRVVVSDVYEDVEIRVTAQQILSKYAVSEPTLSHCSITNIEVAGSGVSNMPEEIDANATLTFNIEAESNYEFKNLDNVTITVGGTPVTPTLNDGVVEVELTVTGVVVISATATAKQTAQPFTSTLTISSFDSAPSSFTTDGTEYTKTDNTIVYSATGINSNGNVRGNQSAAKANFNIRNRNNKSGYYISRVTITVSGGTLDSSTSGRSTLYMKNTMFTAITDNTAPSGTTISKNTSQTTTTRIVWDNTNTNFNYFILYNLKTSGTCTSAVVTVVWTPIG